MLHPELAPLELLFLDYPSKRACMRDTIHEYLNTPPSRRERDMRPDVGPMMKKFRQADVDAGVPVTHIRGGQ
jgi:hypothetical protein